MAPKRKAPKEPPPETQFVPDDSAQMFEAECILDEMGPRGGSGKYLIKWVGTDPATGEPWDPSWESKRGANQLLIDEWHDKRDADPSIIGIEGAKFQAMLKARVAAKKEKENEKKRKRAGQASGPVAQKKKKGGKGAAADGVLRLGLAGPSRPRKNTDSNSVSNSVISTSEVSTPLAKRKVRRIQSESHSPSPEKVTSPIAQEDPKEHVDAEPTTTKTANEPKVKRKGKGKDKDKGKDTDVVPPPSADAEEFADYIPFPSSPSPSRDIAAGQDPPAMATTAPSAPPATTAPGDHSSRTVPAAPTMRRQSIITADAGPSKISSTTTTTLKKTLINLSNALPLNNLPPARKLPISSNDLIRDFLLRPPADEVDPTAAVSGTQSTSTPKSVPISQADPIDSFSSPLREQRGENAYEAARTQASLLATPNKPLAEEAAVLAEEEHQEAEASEEQAGEMQEVGHDSAEDAEEGVDDEGAPVDGEESPEVEVDGGGSDEVAALGEIEVSVNTTVEEQVDDVAESAPSAPLDHNPEEEMATDAHVLAETTRTTTSALTSTKPVATETINYISTVTDMTSLFGGPISVKGHVTVVDIDAHQVVTGIQTLHQRIALLNKTVSEQKTIIADLDASLERAKRTIQSNQEQYSFVQDQYQQASNAAYAGVGKNRELEQTIELLRGQLQHGLKQRDLHHKAVQSKNNKEMDQLRAQNKMLLDQARLTDDRLRAQAVAYIPTKRRNEFLEAEMELAAEKVRRMEVRNDDLVGQLELMRAKQMGVIPGDSDDDDDDDDDSSYNSDVDSGATESDNGGSVSQSQNHNHETLPDGFISSSQLMPSETQLGYRQVPMTSPGAAVVATPSKRSGSGSGSGTGAGAGLASGREIANGEDTRDDVSRIIIVGGPIMDNLNPDEKGVGKGIGVNGIEKQEAIAFGDSDELGDEVVREGMALRCQWEHGTCKSRFRDRAALKVHVDEHVAEQA